MALTMVPNIEAIIVGAKTSTKMRRGIASRAEISATPERVNLRHQLSAGLGFTPIQPAKQVTAAGANLTPISSCCVAGSPTAQLQAGPAVLNVLGEAPWTVTLR